jgi:hypothetical protein
VVLTFLGLWSSRGQWKASRVGWLLGYGGVLLAIFVFIVKNRFLSPALIAIVSNQWVVTTFFAAAFLGVVVCLFNFLKNKQDAIFIKWALSLALIGFLIFPMISNPNYSSRFVIVDPNTHGAGSIENMIGKFWFSIHAHFMGAGIFGTSAFDLQASLLIVLGFIFFLANPNWRNLILLAGVGMGFAPHFIPEYTYNGRAATCIPPIFLMAVLGLEGLRIRGGKIWGEVPSKLFFMGFIVIFFAWQAVDDYQIIYKNQIYSKWIEALVSREVIQDSPANRVYLTAFPYASSAECQGIMDEGHPLYYFLDSNPICLGPSESSKDVVVIVFGGDLKRKALLEKEFPKAEWTPITFKTFHYPTAVASDPEGIFYRVFIKADQLTRNPHQIIYLAPNANGRWKRDFYCGGEGPKHSCIYSEDYTQSLRAPFPPVAINDASFEGHFVAPVDGKYGFLIKTRDVVHLNINQTKVFDLTPSPNETLSDQKSVFLKKGTYPIYYDAFFRDGNAIPEIQVTEPNAPGSQEIDNFSK